MIYCGQLKQSTAVTKIIGQLFDFADSKTLLSDALGGNANFDPTDLTCTLTKGITQTTLILSKSAGDNDMNLVSGGLASLELTAANTDTLGDLIISLENAVEGSEIIFPCSFKFDVVAESMWTEQKFIRVMAAKAVGIWQLKAGTENTYEILDADDGETVVLEATISANSPVIYVVKI